MIVNKLVFHIAYRKDWEKGRQQGNYTTSTLTEKGYIRCFSKNDVLKKANKSFHNQKDLLLLYIDPSLVKAEMKGTNIFGPIDTDTVIRIVTLKPQSDGSFVLPPDLV